MRLVNPAEVWERYNWYMDVMENKPESALDKALNEATDYNDQPHEGVAITLTVAEWETVQHWLQYGADYHKCKRAESLANCKDHRMAAQLVAGHEAAAERAESVWKIIEGVLIPTAPPETE